MRGLSRVVMLDAPAQLPQPPVHVVQGAAAYEFEDSALSEWIERGAPADLVYWDKASFEALLQGPLADRAADVLRERRSMARAAPFGGGLGFAVGALRQALVYLAQDDRRSLQILVEAARLAHGGALAMLGPNEVLAICLQRDAAAAGVLTTIAATPALAPILGDWPVAQTTAELAALHDALARVADVGGALVPMLIDVDILHVTPGGADLRELLISLDLTFSNWDGGLVMTADAETRAMIAAQGEAAALLYRLPAAQGSDLARLAPTELHALYAALRDGDRTAERPGAAQAALSALQQSTLWRAIAWLMLRKADPPRAALLQGQIARLVPHLVRAAVIAPHADALAARLPGGPAQALQDAAATLRLIARASSADRGIQPDGLEAAADRISAIAAPI